MITPTPNPVGVGSKPELRDNGSFRNLSEARLEASHYLAYYNAERRYAVLRYLASKCFETHFQIVSQRCASVRPG
jgi:putative transposase